MTQIHTNVRGQRVKAKRNLPGICIFFSCLWMAFPSIFFFFTPPSSWRLHMSTWAGLQLQSTLAAAKLKKLEYTEPPRALQLLKWEKPLWQLLRKCMNEILEAKSHSSEIQMCDFQGKPTDHSGWQLPWVSWNSEYFLKFWLLYWTSTFLSFIDDFAVKMVLATPKIAVLLMVGIHSLFQTMYEFCTFVIKVGPNILLPLPILSFISASCLLSFQLYLFG